MAVLWGFHLCQEPHKKFEWSSLWSDVYHFRRTRLVLYLCTTILSICSLSLSAAITHDYATFYEGSYPSTAIHHNNIIGIASYNTVVMVASITLFSCGFLLDALWPERRESDATKSGWKICVILSSLMALADGVAFTVIVATGNVYIKDILTDDEALKMDITESISSVLAYRENAKCVAVLVLLWLDVVCTLLSTLIYLLSAAHIQKYGVYSRKHRPSRKDMEVPKWEIEHREKRSSSTTVESV